MSRFECFLLLLEQLGLGNSHKEQLLALSLIVTTAILVSELCCYATELHPMDLDLNEHRCT
jgi:hypothetical protein